jgi:type I restriction-modification system DNA methylase subunit
LFDDNNPEDRLMNVLAFNINDWLIRFVEILESYDFTIDESSSQYQQVAVDPEMLGRIFENLLASQNEETEKIANQRKAFGAFYTPREIVDYMVNESIKAYLQTQLSESGFTGLKDEQDLEKKIAPLFAATADASQLKKEEKKLLDDFLKNIKVLDPACGSGAFPMGILHKLKELREQLGFYTDPYQLKLNILSNNIYGVDI